MSDLSSMLVSDAVHPDPGALVASADELGIFLEHTPETAAWDGCMITGEH